MGLEARRGDIAFTEEAETTAKALAPVAKDDPDPDVRAAASKLLRKMRGTPLKQDK
jgi:hypothetical protein